MLKAIRRVIGLFAFLAIVLGAVKSLFSWADRSQAGSHEVFDDEEEGAAL
jgi:hypothetical protein